MGRRADRGRGPGEGLRRQAGRPLRLLRQRPGDLRHRHADGPGRRAAAVPDAGRTVERDVCRAERLARSLRRSPLSGRRRPVPATLLPGHRHRAGAGRHRRRGGAHPADPGHRHGQDVHRLSDRMEAVPQPLEPERPADPPSADPVPDRPQHPGRPGVQRLLPLPRRCDGTDRARGHPQERQSAEERQPVFHHFPDLYDRADEGRQAVAVLSASTRGISSTLSSSTSAIGAARTTKARGGPSWTTSPPPCNWA